MPCRDDRDNISYREDPETRRRLDNVTRMLCSVCSKISGRGIISKVSGLTEWWEEHQEADRQRLKREAAEKARKNLKAKALAKLSPEEKKILGL